MRFGRLKDLFSTLRFRLLLWVTVVVLVMVVVTMVTVRIVVHRALLFEFSRLLVEEADAVVTAVEQNYPDTPQLGQILRNKVEALSRREWFREWFIEVYTADGQPFWASTNVPPRLAALRRDSESGEPVDMDG